MLQINHVVKRFPPAPVLLDGLSLTMQQGEIVGLMGPSGCGKTTLLRMIAGLDQPDQGTIRFRGNGAQSADQRPTIGYVCQVPHLYPHMNIEQNLAIGWRLQYNDYKFWWLENRSSSELRQRLDQVVQLLELAAIMNRPLASLSGGERQRVCLGRTLVRRPAVFLLDEPLAYLDRALAERLAVRMHSLFKEWHSTVVWVTHHEAEAHLVCDHIGKWQNGLVQLVANTAKLAIVSSK